MRPIPNWKNILCLNGVNPLKNVEGVKGQTFWPGIYNYKTEEHMLWMPPANDEIAEKKGLTSTLKIIQRSLDDAVFFLKK